ncbi:EamA family transporter [Enterococcus eurekensis]|uniref:EamA family transporter n=1 Tax=Enterococcus eurekensis TaxID=1159753 RepID=A0ABV9M5P2_9ENTE
MILFILYVILSTSGLVLFKIGANSLTLGLQKSIFSMQLPLISLLGLTCYLISFVLWMYIISKSDISFIVPLGVALTNLAVLFSSYFILKEEISITTIIGAAIIILGVIVINIK